MKRVKVYLLLCAILCITFVVNDITAATLHKKGVSISVPDGWKELPREAIDAFEKKAVQMAPDAPTQKYEFGLQLKDAKNWFDLPYMLVRIVDNDRISETDLINIESYPVQEVVDKTKKHFGNIDDLVIGQPYYDKERNIIWVSTDAGEGTLNSISGLSGIIPTDKGFVQVLGYA